MKGYALAVRAIVLLWNLFNITADVFLDESDITKTITDEFNRDISILTTTDNEIDSIFIKWDPPEGKPFNYYYATKLTQNSKRGFTYNIDWNTIRTLEERKQGRGTVSLETKKGETVLKKFTFSIYIQWKPNATVLLLEYPGIDNIIRGQMLTLTCTCPDDGNPVGNLVWKVDDTIMTGGIYNSNIITFDQVQTVQDGTWECYYENVIGIGNSSSENVEVKWKPSPPSLMLYPPGNYTMRDNSITFICTCPDEGNPPGTVKWNPEKDPVTNIAYSGKNVTIDKVKPQHGREWRCYYENVIGSVASNSIKLEVKWPPGNEKHEISTNPELVDNMVRRGQKVDFECTGDPGNPREIVLWKNDSNVIRVNNATQSNILNLEPNNNGTLSCVFINKFGNGTESQGLSIVVLLTPLKPAIKLENSTSSSISISITPKKESELFDYNGMYITLEGNNTQRSKLQPVDVFESTFHNLDSGTSYNISVFYNNDIGDGEPAFERYNTKPLPVLKTPSITRNVFSLTAMVEMIIENPDSASEIKISVCGVSDTNSSNCPTETITEITPNFSKRAYGSFSERLVNVTIYDHGVQVYTYGDEIGLAVGVIVLVALAGILLVVVVVVVIVVVVIKKKDKDNNKQVKEVEEDIDPYSYSNPNSESRTGTGPAKALKAPPVNSVVNKEKPLAPIAASPAYGPVYSQVDWSKKNNRQSFKGLPMSKKAIDKITFSKKDGGSINMHIEVSKKFTGEIEIDVCREGDQSSKSKVSKQHVGDTKYVVMEMPIKVTSKDKYTINMKFIVKGKMVQEVDLTYPYDTNSVNVTVLNDAYVTSGTSVKAQEMPEYSEVNKSKKSKGSEMPTYSEVNKPKKKKKAAVEQLYEDVETKNQPSHNDRSTNAVSPSNAEVAVEGVPPHPPRKGAQKEGVMYAELDLNSSGAPRLLPRLGSKSPTQEPVIYADVRPGQNDVV